jgi:ABC-2 type transport system permease protein
MNLLKVVRKNIVLGFVRKEFKQMLREVRMRAILFAAPVLMLLLFGYAVNTDVKNIRFAIFDEDKTAMSREFIEEFAATDYFQYYADITSARQINNLLDTMKVELVFHIPAGFQEHLSSGRDVNVQLLIDGADASRANVINAYVSAITNNYAMGLFQKKVRLKLLSRTGVPATFKKTIELEERFWFNPELSSRNFFLPGILGMIISMITITLTSMSIVKEREIGTIEQLIVTPIHPLELIAGKTLPFIIVSLFDTIVITIVMLLWFNVPFLGSFLFMLLCSLGFILFTSAVGVYISTISKTQQQALLSVFLFFMPAMLLSGFVFPISSMPMVVQWITYLNPLRYYITIIRGIFLKGVGFDILWPDLSAVFILGSVLVVFATRRFHRRLG